MVAIGQDHLRVAIPQRRHAPPDEISVAGGAAANARVRCLSERFPRGAEDFAVLLDKSGISTSPPDSVNPDEKAHFAVEIRRCADALGREGAVALGRLYDLTAGRLVRYAQMWTHSRDDAEDALQAAMLKLAAKPKRLADARHPWAYCLRVVRNEAVTIVRRRTAARSIEAVGNTPAAPPHDLAFQDLADQVRAALAKLPPPQAEVIVLKIWEQMTFSEIAEVLNESPNTAASRYRYGLEKLTRSLQTISEEILYE